MISMSLVVYCFCQLELYINDDPMVRHFMKKNDKIRTKSGFLFFLFPSILCFYLFSIRVICTCHQSMYYIKLLNLIYLCLLSVYTLVVDCVTFYSSITFNTLNLYHMSCICSKPLGSYINLS